MDDRYLKYYLQQAGSGVGPVFTGATYQRGHGIGSFLSNLFRSVFPLIKSGAKAVGKEALNAGFGLLRDTINQKPIKQSLKHRMRDAGESLMTQVENKIDTMKGSGYKKMKRKRKQQSRRVVKRRRTSDIFS